MTDSFEQTHVKLILPINDAYRQLHLSIRRYTASQARLEESFGEVIRYLLVQDWFYEAESFLEEEALEDAIFDELQIHDRAERLAYLGGFLRFAAEMRSSLIQYRVPQRWVQHELIRAGAIGLRDYTAIFFESVPVPKGCHPRGLGWRR